MGARLNVINMSLSALKTHSKVFGIWTKGGAYNRGVEREGMANVYVKLPIDFRVV
jgi:hypothetical protein